MGGAWTYRAVRWGDRLKLTTGTVLVVDEIGLGDLEVVLRVGDAAVTGVERRRCGGDLVTIPRT